MELNHQKKNIWIPILILASLIFLTYASSLNNAFVSDDIAEIRDNPNIGHFSFLFTHPFGFIRLFLNWLAFHLGGLNPPIFRLINIGFHLGSVILIFILLKKILSEKIAFFTAAIFAIHPAIAEAVVWISGGTYPQYSFFFLLSFLFYIQSKGRKFFYLLSSIFYLLSFMSHPVMPLGLFVLFPLYEFAFGDLKKNWPKVIPYLIVSLAYAAINFGVLPERETTLQSVHYQERGIDNPFILIPVAISSYFQLIFFPKTLTLYHSELAFGTVEYIIRILFTIGFFVSIAISFFKNKKIFFWLTFFLIALSPTLTPFRLNWIVAERYLYLPILGIIVLFVLAVEKLSRTNNLKSFKALSVILISVLILALSVRTIIRNIDWTNEDNLWIATGKTSPSSPNNHNNLGDVYGRHGDKLRAIQEFQTAINLKPNYADAYHNMANAYRELGELDKALENYETALKFNPHLWQSYQNIAAIYFQQKQYDKALENIQKAISKSPKNLNLYINLGVVYLAKGEKEKAKEVFIQILTSDPTNQIAQAGLAEANK